MHDGMPYGRNQGQGHSREVDRQSPTGLIFCKLLLHWNCFIGLIVYVGFMLYFQLFIRKQEQRICFMALDAGHPALAGTRNIHS